MRSFRRSRSFSRLCLRSCSVAVFLLLVACSHRDVKLRTAAVQDRSLIPVLNSDEVTTLISDSGITRYRISASKWQIYDKAQPPYWEFPKGIYLEKFNDSLAIEETIKADYAYYNDQSHVWHLKGNVHAVNQNNEQFDTPDLYWDQDQEKIYSDSTITITKARSIINGVGFTANQSMTNYTIHHPTGVIPIEEDDK